MVKQYIIKMEVEGTKKQVINAPQVKISKEQIEDMYSRLKFGDVAGLIVYLQEIK